MTSPEPRRRTARELAERHGVSVRTVQRMVSRPRDWWTQHRRDMQAKAAQLRNTGMKWAEVGAALGVSENAARALGKRGSGAWADSSQQKIEQDTSTVDMFGGPNGSVDRLRAGSDKRSG